MQDRINDRDTEKYSVTRSMCRLFWGLPQKPVANVSATTGSTTGASYLEYTGEDTEYTADYDDDCDSLILNGHPCTDMSEPTNVSKMNLSDSFFKFGRKYWCNWRK